MSGASKRGVGPHGVQSLGRRGDRRLWNTSTRTVRNTSDELDVIWERDRDRHERIQANRPRVQRAQTLAEANRRRSVAKVRQKSGAR